MKYWLKFSMPSATYDQIYYQYIKMQVRFTDSAWHLQAEFEHLVSQTWFQLQQKSVLLLYNNKMLNNLQAHDVRSVVSV